MARGLSSKLGFGPMSPEAVEAVFSQSQDSGRQLMLIASKNQIDHSGGYVNGWTTATYMDFINQMRDAYPQADVKICRDHCGPGFNGNRELADTYVTIEEDIAKGFDLIHIDFCHINGTKEEIVRESRKAIEYARGLNPRILLEIGTDDNVGTHYGSEQLEAIGREMNLFREYHPEFFVVQTGSLVKEIRQVGMFNADFISQVADIAQENGIKLKEHNADYLPREQIAQRSGLIDAFNIAPQIGVVQTNTVMNRCLVYGIPFGEFLDTSYRGEKWKKWLHNATPDDRNLCATISGHYHFASPAYRKIIDALGEREDIKTQIVNRIKEVIQHYDDSTN